MTEAQRRLKLGVMKSLMEGGCDARCMRYRGRDLDKF